MRDRIEIASALTAGRCIRRTWAEAWQRSGLERGAWPSGAGRSRGSTAGPWRRRTCASTPAVQNRRVSFRRQRERRVVRRGHQSSVQSMVQPRARPNSIQSRDNIAAVVLFFALLLPTGPGTYPRPAKLPAAAAAMRSDPARVSEGTANLKHKTRSRASQSQHKTRKPTTTNASISESVLTY